MDHFYGKLLKQSTLVDQWDEGIAPVIVPLA